MRPDKLVENETQSTDDKRNRVLQNDNGQANIEESEETEIAAQITVPHEGGWGWVVVISAFCGAFILDGVAFTYGSLYNDITADLKAQESLVGLVNSLSMTLYFLASPVISAFINRFGFRACAMTGSIICSFGLLWSYFVTSITLLCVSYGIVTGLGFCFINMTVSLVAGFHFERIRSLALSIATVGSCAGVMVLYPINAYLVSLAGWRIVTLMHSGLFGLVYYSALVYGSLSSLSALNTTDDAARDSLSRIRTEEVTPTATKRLFSAVSDDHFRTLFDVKVENESVASSMNQPGPSAAPASKLTLTAHNPHGALTTRQQDQVKSILSRTSLEDKANNSRVDEHDERPKRRSWWASLYHRDKPVVNDVFYDGQVDQSTLRRILGTMMNTKLLARCSFRFICLSGFLTYIGYIVPFIFIQDRNMSVGIDPTYCDFYVSVIGFMNIVGKIIIGTLADKLDPVKLYYWSCIVPGLATIASNLSFNAYYQYVYCAVYGFFVDTLSALRSVIIVNLYGLENLTNASGIMLLFQGLGSLISTPMASILKNLFGYSVAFCAAGTALVVSGIVLIPVTTMSQKENGREINNVSTKNPTPTNVQKSK